jgi:hypothetical protein
VGVYPAERCPLLFRAEPISVSAVARRDAQSGVDVHYAAVLEFPDGRTASVEGGFDQTFTIRYEIVGPGGVITAERAYQPGDGPVTLHIRCGDDVHQETVPGANHYVREIEHFGRACAMRASPCGPAKTALLKRAPLRRSLAACAKTAASPLPRSGRSNREAHRCEWHW